MTTADHDVAGQIRRILADAACSRSLLDAAPWLELSALVSTRTSAAHGMVISVRRTDPCFTMLDSVVSTWSSAAIGRIRSFDAEHDPERILLNRRGFMRSGLALTLGDVLSRTEVSRSHFVNEVMIPAGLSHVLSLTTRLPSKGVLVMSLYFEDQVSLERHRPEATQLMQILVDDVRGAAMHRRTLAELRDARLALDRLELGVILVDEGCRVMSVNAGADEVLRHGTHLLITGGKLIGATKRTTEEVQSTVTTLVEQLPLHHCRELVIHDPSRRPLQLNFVLLSRCVDRGLTGTPSACLACFITPAVDRIPKVTRLERVFQSYYELSDAQARVTARFAAGHAESEIAVQLRVTRDTVKTHLSASTRKIRAIVESHEGRKSLLVRLGERHDVDVLEG